MSLGRSGGINVRERLSTAAGPRLVVVSPHLDDATLSLGAAIAYAAHGGVPVTVLTVFAGDPTSTEPAAPWDALCGFASAGEAARVRRDEDAQACRILGASSVWLPFAYGDYAGVRNEDEIWNAVRPHLDKAGLVLIPGHPLAHADHAWIARLIARSAPASARLGVYVEQPYANLAAIGRGYVWRTAVAAAAIAARTEYGRALQRPSASGVAELLDAQVAWHPARAGRRDRRAKIEAIEAYASQRRSFSRHLVSRIRLYEWGWGGEGIGLPGAAVPQPGGRRGTKWDVRAHVRERRTRSITR